MQNRSHPDYFRFPFARLVLAGMCLLAGLAPASFAETPAPKSPAALFALGQRYLKGEGVPRDERKCVELMQKAAGQGHAEALAMLGYCHSVGAGVEKNDEEARRIFSEAAEKGSAAGQGNLGLFLIRGRGGEKEIERGIDLMQKAAAAGSQTSAVMLGEIFYFGEHANGTPDFRKAYAALLGPAEAGQAAAQNMIGLMLKDGRLDKMDEPAARVWLERAAVQGNAKACFNLGELLWNHRASDRWTRLEAVRWLMVSEKLGETMAARFLDDIEPGLGSEELKAAEGLAAITARLLPGRPEDRR